MGRRLYWVVRGGKHGLGKEARGDRRLGSETGEGQEDEEARVGRRVPREEVGRNYKAE